MFAIPAGPELLIILLLAVLLFGSAKLPKLARSIGESAGELKKGKMKAESELEEMRELEKTDDDETN